MSREQQIPVDELKVDAAGLYREDTFTDLQAATLRRLTPVKDDGSGDPLRPVLFVASTQILTPVGLLPVSAQLEARDLRAAIAEFPTAIRDAVDRLLEEAREAQRQEASRLVVAAPGSVPPPRNGPISLR